MHRPLCQHAQELALQSLLYESPPSTAPAHGKRGRRGAGARDCDDAQRDHDAPGSLGYKLNELNKRLLAVSVLGAG